LTKLSFYGKGDKQRKYKPPGGDQKKVKKYCFTSHVV